MLVQTTRRERILVYGSFKLGKSFCWLDIADSLHRSGNRTPHFYVIDTDFGVEKMLDEGFGHLEDDNMLTLYNPLDFEELMVASREIRKKAVRGDWVVIDMASYPWAEAQAFYTRGVFGDEPDNYFIQMRQEVVAKDGKDKRAYGGYEGTDWGYITKVYKEFELPLTMKGQWNVFAVSEESKLDADRGASPEQVKLYKNVGGMAPAGQKGLGHRFDTVLRMTKRANGQRQITMVGDRGREHRVWERMESRTLNIDEPPNAFAQRYLVDIAGWEQGKTPKKGKKARDEAVVSARRQETGTGRPARRR
jgi:hypothetical protein